MPSWSTKRVRAGRGGGGVFPALALLIALTGLPLGCTSRWRRPVSDLVIASRQSAMRGMEAESHGKWEEAEGYYRQAIQECPANEQARRRHADALWRRDQRSEAIVEMLEAVRLSGGDPEMTVELGRMYLAVGQVDQAERLADRAIQQDRQRAEAWALRGDVQRQRGDAYEALANYHRALSYQPDLEPVQYAIAGIYRQQGKPQRALSTTDAVLDRYPPKQAPQQAFHLRGLALADLGRYEASIESLNAALRQGPPHPDLYYDLADAQRQSGDLAAARYTLQEALRLNPDHLASQKLLAIVSDEPPAQIATRIKR